MHIGAFAKRKAEAIAEIGRKTGIDLSPGSLKIKAPDAQTRDLFMLEKIASELPEIRDDAEPFVYLDDAVEIIANVKGVGVTLAKKIEEALKEQS